MNPEDIDLKLADIHFLHENPNVDDTSPVSESTVYTARRVLELLTDIPKDVIAVHPYYDGTIDIFISKGRGKTLLINVGEGMVDWSVGTGEGFYGESEEVEDFINDRTYSKLNHWYNSPTHSFPRH